MGAWSALVSLLRRKPTERGWAPLVAREEEQFRLQVTLSRYLPRDVAESIARGEAPPEARRAEVSVLFCDLRGFTFLCERERPEDVVDLLNVFFEKANAMVEVHGGSINKLLGDGLLALFGAPTPLAAHADAAADCALDLLDWVRALRERGGVWTHLACGIGIDTGDVVLGPIGSASRREYTAIGSPVNRAARLQALAEREHQRVIVSEATRRALARRHRPASLGAISLKGFATPEQVFYLSPRRAAAEPDTAGRAAQGDATGSSIIRVTPVTQVTGLARLEELTSEVTPGVQVMHTDPFTQVTNEITLPTGELAVAIADADADATRLQVRPARREDSVTARNDLRLLESSDDTGRQPPAPRATPRR